MAHLIPPEACERYLQLDEGKVRLLHGGKKDTGSYPAVLIHGGGYDNSGISWYRLFEPLSKDREVIAIDLPGFGGSKDIEPLGGPVELAKFVARVLDRLDCPLAIVFGVSMGGDIALNFSLQFPQRTAALVLIGPGGLVPIFKNRFIHPFAWMGMKMPDWLLLPMIPLANRFAGSVLRSMVKDINRIPKGIADEFIREAQTSKAGIAYGRYNQATFGPKSMQNNLLPRVKEIMIPTLFFHGADDPLVPIEGSQAASRLIPNAKLVVVPDCGHWAQLEAHEMFLEEVHLFLSEIA